MIIKYDGVSYELKGKELYNVTCIDQVELSMPSTLRDLANFIETVEGNL